MITDFPIKVDRDPNYTKTRGLIRQGGPETITMSTVSRLSASEYEQGKKDSMKMERCVTPVSKTGPPS